MKRRRWVVKVLDACRCCIYRYRYETRAVARMAGKRLRVVHDLRGRPTKLRRTILSIRQEGKPAHG